MGKAVSIGDNLIFNENEVELLGITFNNAMNFHTCFWFMQESKEKPELSRMAK